jgi:hypothetical protein
MANRSISIDIDSYEAFENNERIVLTKQSESIKVDKCTHKYFFLLNHFTKYNNGSIILYITF